MANQVYEYIEAYEEITGEENSSSSSGSTGNMCTYDINGESVSNIKVRLMQAGAVGNLGHCGGTYGEPMEGEELIDFEKTREQLNFWMTHKYGWETAETHYLKIRPRIICEKIIETVDGTLPNDFKFFCFNGEPKFFYYGYDRENEFKKLHCDLNWNVIDITKEKATLTPNEAMKPKCFDQMIKYARILSQGIPFVRVDFYDSKDKVVFGEMTFTPTAGMSEIYTEEAAEWMGDMIELPKEGR